MKQTLFAVLLFLSVTVAATPVGPMNYQGRLLDNAGIPVTGSYNFVVKIYNDPVATVPANVLKYQESHNGVSVDDGVYSFKVGTGTNVTGSWDLDLWQGNLNDLYLEIMVGNETLAPRHELTSAPHSFTSTLALHANTVGYLGGQSTDNVLVAICKSSKGAWLDIADKCLGPGADFSVAAVGGSVVNIATLHSGTNFTGIDLSKADISGINFGVANLSAANFKETIYNSSGIRQTNLAGSAWNGAIDLNATPSVFTGSLYGATIKNMNLGKWNLSGLTEVLQYRWLSAAELSACPNVLPIANTTNHDCIEQAPSSGRYGIIGLEFRLSADSAAVSEDGNLNMPDIAGKNIQVARFDGARITQDFSSNWMQWVDFTRSKLVGNKFINNSRMMDLYMDGIQMDGVLFYGQGSESWTNWSLKNASLNNVLFQPTGANVPTGFNFTGAHLSNVYFPETTNMNFTDALLDSISLDVDPSAVAGKNPATNFNFTNAKLTGNLRLDLSANGTGCTGHTECRAQLPGVQVYNAAFLFDPPGNVVGGGLSKADFSNCSIVRTEFAVTAMRTNFTSCTFREVVVKANANFGNATFTSVTGRDDQIWWEAGAICPNNTAVTNSGFSGASPYGCFGKW